MPGGRPPKKEEDKLKQLTVYLPSEIIEALDKDAEAKGFTGPSQAARVILTRAFKSD